jgi:hypothetical protein
MNTDTEPHLLTGRPVRVLLCHGVLNLHGALHGIHGTGEIGKHAVPSRVEDPAAMRGDQAIE